MCVVDSVDKENLQQAAVELGRILNDREMKDAVLLVVANKQDLPGAMSSSEITDALGLSKIRDREWFVQPASAMSGDGLMTGLEWLASKFKVKGKQ